MGLRVNFTETGDVDFPVMPAGTYAAKVTDGELREAGPNAKHPGSEYINWEFTIQDGEYQGRKVWQNTSLIPEALVGLKGLLSATGKFDVDAELDFEIEDVIGADVAVVVRQREYQGEMQNEVRRVKPLSDANTGDSSLLP